MPYFSDDIIEEVRSRNDIVDVIGQYVHLTKKGSTYFGLCPFHNEKTGSFRFLLTNRCIIALDVEQEEMFSHS